MTPPLTDDWRPWAGARLHELGTAIAFSTRLPVGRGAPVDGAGLGQAAWALPLAGLVVGLAGAAVFALADWAAMPAWPAAALAVAATLLVSGALHEDGLADTADGFGGGDSRERKLAIMRDSRIGTYGVCALALSILIRVSALANLADAGLVAAALIAAHTAARAAMPVLMVVAAPARSDGLSYGVGRIDGGRTAIALAIGAVALLACLGLPRTLEAVVALAVIVAVMTRLSLRQIGGQTGDVVGALEQVCEIAVLLVALR